MIGLDWEEKQKEKRRNKLIMKVLAIFAVIGLAWMGVTTYLDYEKHLDSENITVVTEETESNGGEWNKTKKVLVKTVGIAVEAYSFDGGINWQESNEFFAVDKDKVVIVVRDLDGKESLPLSYKVDNVDSIPPVINVNVPAKVIQNSKIDLGKYVSAIDDNSGLDGGIVMEPDSLDTSKVGIKTIKFSAKDKAGNESSFEVSVEIVKKDYVVSTGSGNSSGSSKPGSTVTGGESKPGGNETPSEPSKPSEESPSIGEPDNPVQENPSSGEVSDPVEDNPTEENPGVVITPVGTSVTLYRYRVKNTIKYECRKYDCSYYKTLGNVQVRYDNTGRCSSSESVYYTSCDGKKCAISSSPIVYTSISNGPFSGIRYKTAPCSSGSEIEKNGYCHAICAYGRYYCSRGQIVGSVCQERVEKICYDICTTITWSEWSEWSETVITPSETIQVETKVVEK